MAYKISDGASTRVCERACVSVRVVQPALLGLVFFFLFFSFFFFFLFIFIWFFLISLPSSSSQQRGWSTRTHIYKAEEYAVTNFAVAHKYSSTQLHCVLPLDLGSRSDKI